MHRSSYSPIAANACFLLLSMLPTQSFAQSDIDRAFEMQGAHARSRLSVDGEVKDAQSKSQNTVADRYIAKERARAEETRRLIANANSSTNDSSSTSAKNPSDTNNSSSKIWRCKIHCKSANGPVIWKELSAKNRSEAARWVGDHADQLCNVSGEKFANPREYSESQCQEK